MEPSGECRFVRAGIHAKCEAADDRNRIPREAVDELLARFLPIARHCAASNNREQFRPCYWHHPAHPQFLRHLWYLPQLLWPLLLLEFPYFFLCSHECSILASCSIYISFGRMPLL